MIFLYAICMNLGKRNGQAVYRATWLDTEAYSGHITLLLKLPVK